MELLKRYKELKAQGVNITLMELKKQMDGVGVNNTVNTHGTSQVSVPQGVNVATNAQNLCHSELDSESINVGSSRAGENPYSSTYATPKTESFPAYVSSFEQQPQKLYQSQEGTPQTSQQQSYQQQFETSSQLHTTAFMPVQSLTAPSEPVKYSGNIASVDVPVQNTEKKKYALIGYPLGHSLSSFIHDAGFKSLGMDFSYEILETSPDSLVDRIKFLKFNGYSGFNVTIPLKLPVTMFLDEIDMSADIIGAVNTVVINPDKTMKGYNTDVIGFRKAIPDDVTLAGKVAGVLGTGGAARAAITALAQSQVKEIKIYTRSIPNSMELMSFLREKFPHIEFNAYQIERIRDLSDVQILVNTTPIGMQGRAADLTPVEEHELRTLPQGTVVYDVIYNPKKTVLLKLAQKNGYKTINGVDMFIYQALAAEQIWTGRTPDFKDMKIAALENL